MVDNSKLILDNINIANDLAWKFKRKLGDKIELDDLQQICKMGLIIAANTFNSNLKFAFSTYAYKVIVNQVYQELRKYSKFNKLNLISLDVFLESPNNETATILDTIKSDIDIENDVILNYNVKLLNKYISKLTLQQQQIINLYLNNKTQYEIAQILKISQPQVSRQLKRIIHELRIMFKV